MDLPAPVHLVLSSQYFFHLLSWKMGPGCPDGVHYTVRVQTLSRSEVVVKECEKVTFPLECNLTEAFSNVEETYFVSVSAALENRTSPRSFCSAFKPIYNTTLEPPLLTVTVCNQSLCVSLRAPTEKLHSVYKSFRFRYRLTVSSEDGSEFDVDIKELKKKVCPLRTWPLAEDAIISVILCLLMLLLVMCTPRFVSRCFCLKPNLPLVLSSFESKNKVLTAVAEPINKLCEERDSIQKMKRNGEEEDMEGETEEDLKYRRLVSHYLDTQGSPLSVFPTSSSSVLLINQTPDTSLTSSTDTQSCSLIVFEGSHIHTEPTPSPRLPQETSPLQNSSSIFTGHMENEDGESSTDVNLFSVMLGGVSAEQHKPEPDKTRNTDDEQESSATLTWISDSQSQNSESTQMNILEEDYDDDSGYLGRN
ncbi:Interferon alpha/beta receptor 2 [Labeo rohita]|uniref:Interferon alpha/beta receptor 2 n=1 Tax=Labeo rohita TaxID=84645 RepID=A0ABQ8MBQ1_LABRO|nr:Interferon alpha/beta receptor 2 [Labeo rohita]